MKTLITLLAFISVFSYARTATCTSIASGNWADPLIWSCGVVPAPGDTIIIDAAHTVTVSVNTDLTGTPMVIIVNGVLLFDSPGAKLRLECGSSVIVNPGGSIQDSGNGTPSHSIRICGIDVWLGSSGTLLGPVVLSPIPLPVELVSFSASEVLRSVDVTWTTASEHNNDFFTILGSVDGSSWDVIENINGAGNSTQTLNYSFSFTNSMNYEYLRLDQTDYDGESSSSPVVRIDRAAHTEINVYPNPSNGENLYVSLAEYGDYTITIVDLNGRHVFEDQYFSTNNIVLNNLALQSGTFLLKVSSGSEETIEKIMIR
ncbi:MAG: T9SS type A sorting domain-containing protein [Bacteroidetes bacterium]|nr:MAG: T9SS type A sorting domain-containing protein [Bacteroidota bacterium]